MKMSTIVTAIAAVAGGGIASSGRHNLVASASTTPISPLASQRVQRIVGGSAAKGNLITDTARRRIYSAFGSNSGGDCGSRRSHRFANPPTKIHRRGNIPPLAFASSSPLQQPRRYFSDKHPCGEKLPWTPICEGTSISSTLKMTPSNHGTEGFRDAIRGSEEYIKPRGPNRLVQQQSYGTLQQQKQQQQQQHQQKGLETKSSGGHAPFPKMTPGRRRNYRPPHVLSALRVNDEIRNRYPPDDNGVPEKDYCDALDPEEREHCLENFRDGRESARYLNVKGGGSDAASFGGRVVERPRSDNDVVVQGGVVDVAPNSAADGDISEAEEDYCDVLDPVERERCLESFRDGPRERVSALLDRQPPPPRNDDDDISQAEKDYCDVLDPDERERCIESFRDGRQSAVKAKYLPVTKGPGGDREEASRVVEELEVNGGINPTAAAAGQLNDDDYDDDDDPEIDSSFSENFRDGQTSMKFSRRSGSDVDSFMDDDDEPPLILPSDKRKSSIFYDSPSSMSFRDGKARMTTFKDSAFSADEVLLGEGEAADEEEEEDEGIAALDLLLGDSMVQGDKVSGDVAKGKRSISESALDKVLASEEKSSGDDDASVTESDLSIDPKSIDIIPLEKVKEAEQGESTDDRQSAAFLDPISPNGSDFSPSSTVSSSDWEDLAHSGSFVKMFRGSASYIANHRGTLAVYHIPGELLAWEGFPGLMDDIALTWLLGMKIVLVAGCRHQIDLRLDDLDEEEDGDSNSSHLGGRVMTSSIRVTDEETLRVVKEEAGFVRFEIERRLAKSLRLHGGLLKGSETLVGNVVSGNFYSAQPFGVVDGIDYAWTGFPRKVEIERIRQTHETNDIVLLTSLGVSPSGEIFNVNSEFLAATVAGAMSASKIIYFNVHGTSFHNKNTNKPVQNLRVSDAKNLMAHYNMRIHPKGFALVDLDGDSPQQDVLRTPGSMETLIKVGYSMVALEKGVKRAHILAPENGALVQELYTRDGCGTLISRDIYEGIRRGDVNDVSGIYDLIDPLVKAGTLVERPKSTLEKEILSYYVYTRDGLILATGQLKRFEGGFVEIGCLVVSKDYRQGGRGDAMLSYLMRLALQCGAKKVFVLSTQTMEWFVERGFREVTVDSLPPSRQATYNPKRKSKIYMKELQGDRDLDAAELWWSTK